ncbi:TonB-dependent receptor [Alginatibacterium sediminis]|uniref:Vitamin B12 transporter BtuB n=1 Tax=Alginatibacterium sediminis TaxID=2164068 RepID=A0A420E5I5_9ALTE|nr:TonB-dependent receptor [Alginatibacterium sediminis]RKF13109.1 TonB-dependent receptor [Alginatibacterium sediminis]
MKALQYSALALGVVSAIAAAESNNDSTEVETMVITANRFEQTEASVLAATNVVTREDIEVLQAKSTTDVLKTLPGIEIGQNGGRGQVASVFVRGSESTHVLVLVDGFRMARSAKGSVDFNQIPLIQIERIELVRGARASMYGSEAIAGVINIITRAEPGESLKKLNAGIGSFNSYLAEGLGNFEVGDSGQLKLAAGVEDTEGYNAYPTSTNQSDKHGFGSKNAMISYEHQFSNAFSAYIAGRIYDNNSNYDDRFGSYKTLEVNSKNIDGSILYQRASFDSQVKLSFASQQNKDFVGSYSADSYRSLMVIEQLNAAWQNTMYVSDNTTLSGGIDWRNEEISEDSLTYGSADGGAGKKRSNTGIYLLGLHEIGRYTLELSGRSDDNSVYGRNNTWGAAASASITPELEIIALAGTAFKAPDFTQLYYPYGGNENLEPEESQNLELGLRGKQFFRSWRVSAFQNQIDNLIDYVCFDVLCYSGEYQQVEGKSQIRGLEFEGEFNTGKVLHSVSVEFRDPKDSDGEQLLRRAKQIFKWNAEYSLNQWLFTGEVLYQGERKDIGDIDLEPYTTVGAGISYDVTQNLELKLKINNLFDSSYETVNGYPSPERNFLVSGRYEF